MCDYIFMIYKGQKVLDGTLESIQDQYGSDTIRLQAENGRSVLEEISGVEKINDFGKLQEIRIHSSADPQKILAAIMNKTNVQKFEITRPSLYDIFIRIAGPEAKEEENA
jgi:ABC-2 type transport system ATP-binding protein